MINRSCNTTGSNSGVTAEEATMAWCSSRGSVSGHSLMFNITNLYPGLFQLRETLSSRTTLSSEVLPRFLISDKLPLLLLQAIRCTLPTCRCECFAPGKQSLRYCGNCNHGWVAHALDKLTPTNTTNLGLHVEVVQPNIVFDIASLMLYGAHATPVRLKILLDRLFSVLQHDEVLQILHGFGWTYEDYARGYILQNSAGRVLDRWCVATQDEELIVLQQFLRFGETKAIAHEIILQDTKERHEILSKHAGTSESGIKKFIERSNLSSVQSYIKSYESTRQLFVNTPVTFIPHANRVMPPSFISQKFSPGLEPRFPLSHVSPTLSSSLVTAPLKCSQVTKRFDGQKEEESPAIDLSIDSRDTCSTPKCDSPQNLTTTSPVVSVASSSSLSCHQAPHLPTQQHQAQDMDEVDGNDHYISGSDEEEALDCSNKDSQDSPNEASKKGKHVRKSNNPLKRQWTPSVNFGNTFIGPNGKKRVSCTTCNKTFCDKGALKIHYSAVHLKEMHKCTVEGCHMMFSSRRSRNRHSANPNPKLHMPQKRKDELDHSEEIDLSILNGSFTPVASTTPTKPISTPSPVPSIHNSPHMPNNFTGSSSNFHFLALSEKRLRLEEEQPTDMRKLVSPPFIDDEPCDLSKKLDDDVKLEIDLDKCSSERDVVPCNGDVNGNEFKIHNECTFKGGKRRKNAAPIRCAQTSLQSYDITCNKDISPLNLSNHGKLDFNGEQSLNTGKHEEIFSHERSDGSTKDKEYKYRIHLGKVEHFHEDVSFRSHDFNEERNGKHESKNFHKMSSMWEKNARTDSINVTEDDLQNDLYPKSEVEFTQNEENTKFDALDVDANKSDSECQNSEDDESFLCSGIIQDFSSSVYSDREDPLKCRLCGKSFQNNLTIKVHFQNVHLKTMYPCTVNGCTAAFPSKRSRNRHIVNLDLHRLVHAEDANADHKTDDILQGNTPGKFCGHEVVSMLPKTAAATIDVSEANPARNDNENMNRGHATGSSFTVKEKLGTRNSPTMDIQHGMIVHTSRSSLTGSEVIFAESERESDIKNKVECLVDNTFKVHGKSFDIKFANTALLQDHISISHHDHVLAPSGPLVRKAVSPRRTYSRLSMV